jgi:hypothetical protein
MVNRPCLDCGTLTPNTRCERHRIRKDNQRYSQRGTTTQRGYGHAYRQRRERALTGATHCATCGRPFTADNPATGGHTTDLRTVPLHERKATARTADMVPQCRACNYGWNRRSSEA